MPNFTTHVAKLLVGAIVAALFVVRPAAAQGDGLPPMMLHQQVPHGAVEIAEAMRTAKAGDEIVIRGRISDGSDVFVHNRAILRLADEAALPACCAPGAPSSGGTCAVPANRRATVQFLDGRGRMIRLGLRGLHGLTVGKEVFIVGTVLAADNDRTLIINASGMHVPVGDIPIGLIVDTPPRGAVDVEEVRRTAQPGERVVVRGRVGGAASPLGDGVASMKIVGRAIEACSTPGPTNAADANESAESRTRACKTPWDGCGESPEALAMHTATIQVVDDDGALIRTGLRGRRGIQEFTEVTVDGTVVKTADGSLLIRARAIHVGSTRSTALAGPDGDGS